MRVKSKLGTRSSPSPSRGCWGVFYSGHKKTCSGAQPHFWRSVYNQVELGSTDPLYKSTTAWYYDDYDDVVYFYNA